MATIKCKKLKISELISDYNFKIKYYFANYNLIDFLNKVCKDPGANHSFNEHHDLCFKLLNEFDSKLEILDTSISDALSNYIDSAKKERDLYDLSIKKKLSLLRYSFPLSLLNSKKKNKLLNVFDDSIVYKNYLENLNLEDVLKNYKPESFFLDKEVYYPDFDKKIGDFIYLVYGEKSVPDKDNLNLNFGVNKFEIINLNYDWFYDFPENHQDDIYINFRIDLKAVGDIKFNPKSIQFSVNKDDHSLFSTNTSSLYKIFLSKQDAIDHIDFLSKNIGSNINKLKESSHFIET